MRQCLTRAAAGLLLIAGMSGCAIPFGRSGPPPSPEALAACNTRADEVFTRQNRDAIYKADTYSTSLRDSPYSGSGLPETSAGLSDQYERNRDVRTCLNGAGSQIATEPATGAATAPARALPAATAAP